MKKILLLALIMALSTACANHSELARRYKLDLQYYDTALKFAELNMTDEANAACFRTSTLRSECFTSLIQQYTSNNLQFDKDFCEEIKPEQRMNMTEKAFDLVYPEIDEELEKELKQKLKPSKQRVNALTKIKEDCYTKTK